MNHTALFIRIFGTLLKLYPIPFRSEFEEEMRAVFAAKVVEWAGMDLYFLTVACLREYFDLLYNLPHEYLSGFRKGAEMSRNSRIAFILSGCLFIAGGIFPWASAYYGSTVESFKGVNEILLFLTGGVMLVVSLINPGNFVKVISVLGIMFGLGWGVYMGILLSNYFINPPQFTQNSYYINLGPGLFLTLGACILSIGFGIFQLLSNKRPHSLKISSN